ncbi:MAG: DUF3089 domain-containing protein [Deltaproteobacteria bacterium]|nr:DUF3089 domain-containing protein [Deltaproteobacteria bacterium]
MKIGRMALVLALSCAGSSLVGCSGDGASPGGGSAIDYSKSQYWLSLPSPVDAPTGVDVFYVYPSEYSAGDSGPRLAPIDDPKMAAGAARAFQLQASAFADIGNVYAPYYRQLDAMYVLGLSTIGDIYDAEAGAPLADVTAAFDYYIQNDNDGRPFLLVSHSQGSSVVALLLQTYLAANPSVYARMIAAYSPGWSFTTEYFADNPHLRFAEGPDDTGVIVSYNTMAASFTGRNPVVFDGAKAINPIRWTTRNDPAPASQNLGSLALDPTTGQVVLPVQATLMDFADARIARIDPATSALMPDSTTNVLLCDVDPSSPYPIPVSPGLSPGFFHNYDYPFYYADLKANARNRVARYLNHQ